MALFAATWKNYGDIALKAATEVYTGNNALDALEAGITAVELHPLSTSVGLRGSHQLDAACMRGYDLRVGAVMALEHIATPFAVARRVMEEGRHMQYAGAGALRWALEHGFRETRLATGNGGDHDTVGCIIRDADGHLYAGTSTSGLRGKEDGRVGDSPIAGAGLYADDTAGACVATGIGETILKHHMSGAVVELMRSGASAEEACHTVCSRVRNRDLVALLAVSARGDVGSWATRDEGFVAVVADLQYQ